jgi:hypothetical protein
VASHVRELTHLEHARDLGEQARWIDRLREVPRGLELQRAHRALGRRRARDQDDRNLGIALADRLQQLEAAFDRHVQIRDHQVERLARELLLGLVDR